jgi:hypothetical protein
MFLLIIIQKIISKLLVFYKPQFFESNKLLPLYYLFLVEISTSECFQNLKNRYYGLRPNKYCILKQTSSSESSVHSGMIQNLNIYHIIKI